jgi:MEMO1 family protein
MNHTRRCVLAGAWYASDAGELAADVESHLATAKQLPDIASSRPIALIAPHAGHRWSGDAAAAAFNLLRGDAGAGIRRVLLLGPAHHVRFHGISILPVQSYQTPLGEIPVDTDTVSQLLKMPLFQTQADAHSQEHCLEIELPFLQRVLTGPYKIVPMLISQLQPSEWKQVAATLSSFVDEETLILISSDFTHYGSRFGYEPFTQNPDLNLKKLDKGALAPILDLNAEQFAAYKQKTQITICGWQSVGILLEMLSSPQLQQLCGGEPPAATVLSYYRSADLLGDFSGSVSYAAVGFFTAGDLKAENKYPSALQDIPIDDQPTEPATNETESLTLNSAEQQFLLKLARETLEHKLEGRTLARPESFPPGVSADKMNDICGVFVTLTREERLRGCIGTIVGRDPIVEGVMIRAVSAALEDPRFPQVKADELAELVVEISILTPLREVDRADQIVVGRHGVVLEKDGHRAVFLPQVAPEQGWDRDTMLDHLASKAGLPRADWRTGARFQVFEALVFAEVER